MAYEVETTKKQNFADRLSKGLEAGGKVVGEVMDWNLRLKQAEQQRQAFEQQMKAQEQAMEEKRFQMYQVASKQQSDIIWGAMSSGKPKEYMNSNRESFERMTQYGKIKTTFDDAIIQAEQASPIVMPLQKTVDNAFAVLNDPYVDFKTKQAKYVEGTKALEEMKGQTRNSLFLDTYGIKKTTLDAAMSDASKNEYMVRAAQVKAEGEKNKPLSLYQSDLNERALANAAQKAADKLDNDFILKKLKEQDLSGDFVSQLEPLVAEGNEVAFSALGIKMAKTMGEVGVLTEADVKRYVEGRSLSRKAGDTLSKWISGKPTEATQEDISQIRGVLEKQYSTKVLPIVQRHVERFAVNHLKAKKGDPDYQEKVQDAAQRLGYSDVLKSAKPAASGDRKVVKKGYNKKTNQTQFIYDDGTKEIVDGQQ